MPDLTRQTVRRALDETGRRLAMLGIDAQVRVVICGSMAGMLGGELGGDRLTMDCDVIASEPRDRFRPVAKAAAEVAAEMGLAATWLNDDSRMYAHLLPRGWRTRLRAVGRFGPLSASIVGRQDLLALKLMGALRRPQDLEDMEAMNPTDEEFEFLQHYLTDREAQSLDREDLDAQRSILHALRSRP